MARKLQIDADLRGAQLTYRISQPIDFHTGQLTIKGAPREARFVVGGNVDLAGEAHSRGSIVVDLVRL